MVDLTQWTGKRALVCGGRDYKDATTVAAVLGAMRPATLIHGGAAGADSLAGAWWKRHGPNYALVFMANWDAHGRSAGPIRNARMLAEGKPDVVVAFPGGRGTEDMVTKAKAAGVPVLRVQQDGSVRADKRHRDATWHDVLRLARLLREHGKNVAAFAVTAERLASHNLDTTQEAIHGR